MKNKIPLVRSQKVHTIETISISEKSSKEEDKDKNQIMQFLNKKKSKTSSRIGHSISLNVLKLSLSPADSW